MRFNRRVAGISGAACLAILGLANVVRASHIPGHDDDDPIFPVPIPGQQFFSGGILFVTAIGPPGGSEITNAEFDITYFSDGTTPASDILIEVGYMSEGGYLQSEVTGVDLGFGSGSGMFSGTFSTDALNGVAVESFLFPPHSIVDLTIGSVTGGIQGTGYFEDSFINFTIPEPGALTLLLIGGVVVARRPRGLRARSANSRR